MKQKKSSHVGAIATVIAGLTAAAVGAYYLYGSDDAKKHRAKVKSWMLKAKAEVLEGLEHAKHMTKEEYEELVARVAKGYKGAKNASARELIDFGKDMHAYWKDIERATAKKTATVAGSVAKKATKVAQKKGGKK